MKPAPVSSGKRRSVNLSLDAQMVTAARELGIGLSQTCERALATEVKKERERRWLEENQAAFDYWNDWLEKNGLPYADLRLW